MGKSSQVCREFRLFPGKVDVFPKDCCINREILQERERKTMALKVEVAGREFVFDGHTLPDPDSSMSVERVREMYMPSHPEITTAEVVGPEFVDGKMRYTFNRAIGHKG